MRVFCNISTVGGVPSWQIGGGKKGVGNTLYFWGTAIQWIAVSTDRGKRRDGKFFGAKLR